MKSLKITKVGDFFVSSNTRNKMHFCIPAPLGYVADVGRRTTGFITRFDIGSARDVNDVSDDR